MSIAIEESELREMVRVAVEAQVAALLPVMREELVSSLRFVSEETGIRLLEIGGTEPVRTFRRWMNDYGVHFIETPGGKRFKRCGPNSIEDVMEKRTVKPAPRQRLREAA